MRQVFYLSATASFDHVRQFRAPIYEPTLFNSGQAMQIKSILRSFDNDLTALRTTRIRSGPIRLLLPTAGSGLAELVYARSGLSSRKHTF